MSCDKICYYKRSLSLKTIRSLSHTMINLAFDSPLLDKWMNELLTLIFPCNKLKSDDVRR